MKSFYNFINEELKNDEYENIHRKLNDLFTNFRENVPYLKNIWFKIKYDYLYFEVEIIWFYSYKTTTLISPTDEYSRTIYKLTKQGFNLVVQNYITNDVHHNFAVFAGNSADNLIGIIEKICNLQKYLLLPNNKTPILSLVNQ